MERASKIPSEVADVKTEFVQELQEMGWCHLPLPPDVSAPGVLENFGPLLSAEGACRSGHDLIPYEKASAPRGSMSAITGTDAQPMHTDCAFLHAPPRYTALQCMERGEARCP